MAKPIHDRRISLMEPSPVKMDIQQFWNAPKGIDTVHAMSKLDHNYATEATNVRLRHGYFVSRGGLAPYGPITGTGIQMQVVNFVLSTGVSYVIRFDTDLIYSYNGGVAWDVFTGVPPFTGADIDTWTYTAWNNQLIISNGVDGIFSLEPVSRTITQITEAFPAKQLSTYASRIIASNSVEPGVTNRIRWTTKDSSTDWTGVGSGFEDLLSTPGGQTDSLNGVFPVSEEIAFIVRSDSIWQMGQTGDALAPFRFSRMYHELGSIAPNSIQSTPDGVAFFSVDNIYHIGLSGITTIGDPIKSSLHLILEPQYCLGMYNPYNREYHLACGESIAGSFNLDWVYSFQDGGWTRYVFPFNFRSISSTRYTISSPIDSLVGTITGLRGIIDNLGITQNGEGMFVVASATGKFITLLDSARNGDCTVDGAFVQTDTTIATGAMSIEGDFTYKTQIIQIELEYRSDSSLNNAVQFYVTDSTGAWRPFGAVKNINQNTVPGLLNVVGVASSRDSRIRLVVGATAVFSVVAMYVHLVPDGRRNP